MTELLYVAKYTVFLTYFNIISIIPYLLRTNVGLTISIPC